MMKFILSIFLVATSVWAQDPLNTPNPSPVAPGVTTPAQDDVPGTFVKPTSKQKNSMKKVAKKAKKNAKETKHSEKAEANK